jgi:hypothetical protein
MKKTILKAALGLLVVNLCYAKEQMLCPDLNEKNIVKAICSTEKKPLIFEGKSFVTDSRPKNCALNLIGVEKFFKKLLKKEDSCELHNQTVTPDVICTYQLDSKWSKFLGQKKLELIDDTLNMKKPKELKCPKITQDDMKKYISGTKKGFISSDKRRKFNFKLKSEQEIEKIKAAFSKGKNPDLPDLTNGTLKSGYKIMCLYQYKKGDKEEYFNLVSLSDKNPYKKGKKEPAVNR